MVGASAHKPGRLDHGGEASLVQSLDLDSFLKQFYE